MRAHAPRSARARANARFLRNSRARAAIRGTGASRDGMRSLARTRSGASSAPELVAEEDDEVAEVFSPAPKKGDLAAKNKSKARQAPKPRATPRSQSKSHAVAPGAIAKPPTFKARPAPKMPAPTKRAKPAVPEAAL